MILDRNEVFHRLFEGKRISQKQMFSQIQIYTPTCYPRTLPHTRTNQKNYNNFVRNRLAKEAIFEANRAQKPPILSRNAKVSVEEVELSNESKKLLNVHI